MQRPTTTLGYWPSALAHTQRAPVTSMALPCQKKRKREDEEPYLPSRAFHTTTSDEAYWSLYGGSSPALSDESERPRRRRVDSFRDAATLTDSQRLMWRQRALHRMRELAIPELMKAWQERREAMNGEMKVALTAQKKFVVPSAVRMEHYMYSKDAPDHLDKRFREEAKGTCMLNTKARYAEIREAVEVECQRQFPELWMKMEGREVLVDLSVMVPCKGLMKLTKEDWVVLGNQIAVEVNQGFPWVEVVAKFCFGEKKRK